MSARPAPAGLPDGAIPHTMRAPCPGCATITGYILTTGGQDVVRCAGCHRACYNAPRTETGRAPRTVATVHNGIKPKQRAAVLLRAGARCELCGAPAAATEAGLVVDHMLSVADGLELGLTEVQLNHIENLAAFCEACNAGKGRTTLPLWLVVAVLQARTTGAGGAP